MIRELHRINIDTKKSSNMNKIQVCFFTTLLVNLYCFSYGQLRDGVQATTSYAKIIKKNYASENAFAFSLGTQKISAKVFVRVYVIENINGSSGVRESDISSSLTTLNGYFEAIGIFFEIDSVEILHDYHYSYIAYDHNRSELLTKHTVPDEINLYLADSIDVGNGNVYGFTYFPDAADSNFIFLAKEYLNGNSMATLMGHYMGLLSTHETEGGNELAGESNCAESGDFICDTYADPGLFGQVSDACEYTGSARDDNGKYYVPSVANIMSDSPATCKCGFTPLQYRRMYYYFSKYRQILLKR
jgi:hypothetical protein